jgi:Cu/Ag efflux pump CusA
MLDSFAFKYAKRWLVICAIGADVMKRIAAPLVGGMITAPLLSLIVIPVIYAWWQERGLPESQSS